MTVLLELVLSATYAGQEIINRWNYLATGTPAEGNAAEGLIQAFGCLLDGGVYPDGLPFRRILELVSPGVLFQFASCRDVYSDTDFAEIPFVPPAAGLAEGFGQGMSPTAAYGFRTTRIRADIRRGTKRFVGVGEGGVDALGVVSATAQTLMLTLASTMGATLTQVIGDNTFSYVPVIVGKMKYLPPDNTVFNAAGTAYTYWPTYAVQATHIAAPAVWEIYQTQRTQNSRQYGKGR